MFVSPAAAGMKTVPIISTASISEKSGESLLMELQNVMIQSYTGLSERRELVRSWTASELVQAYTTLRTRILIAQSISRDNKLLLEAMEKEGVGSGGKHSCEIVTENPVRIPHGPSFAITDSIGKQVAGWTVLSVWELTK